MLSCKSENVVICLGEQLEPVSDFKEEEKAGNVQKRKGRIVDKDSKIKTAR